MHFLMVMLFPMCCIWQLYDWMKELVKWWKQGAASWLRRFLEGLLPLLVAVPLLLGVIQDVLRNNRFQGRS